MILFALGTFAIFASAITTNKFILSSGMPVYAFVALRMGVAGVLLLLVRSWRVKHMFENVRRYWWELNVVAVSTTLIPALLKAYGLKHLISSKAAFIGSLDPFLTALYMRIRHGQRLTTQQFFGCCLAFAAVVWMLFTTSAQEKMAGQWLIFSLPECAILLAVCVSRWGWLRAQHLLKNHAYEPSELNAKTMILSAIYAGIASLALGEAAALGAPFKSAIALPFAYTVIGGNMIGYTLYGRLLKRHSATFVALMGLSVPLFVHLCGPLLGEPLSGVFFGAFSLMLVGFILFYKHE